MKQPPPTPAQQGIPTTHLVEYASPVLTVHQVLPIMQHTMYVLKQPIYPVHRGIPIMHQEIDVKNRRIALLEGLIRL